MKCAQSKMSYGGTSPTITDEEAENTRYTPPEKWVATKHQPCFGDNRKTTPAHFGDDMNSMSAEPAETVK